MPRPVDTLAAALAAGLATAAAAQTTGGIMAPPPDYPAVMEKALDEALADGSNGALVMFIARYPDEPQAERARVALAERTAPDATRRPGPDGDIVGAFDRARLAGPAALAAFAAAYANHPLAAEALRPFWQRPR